MIIPFTALGHFDVWPISASLRGKLTLFQDGHGYDIRENGKLGKEVRTWAHLASLLAAINRYAGARNIELGDIWLTRISPSDYTGWDRSIDKWRDAIMPIITNPLTFTFAGAQSQHLLDGVLTLIDPTYPSCVVNFGQTMHVHMGMQVRLKEVPDE